MSKNWEKKYLECDFWLFKFKHDCSKFHEVFKTVLFFDKGTFVKRVTVKIKPNAFVKTFEQNI